MGDYLVQNVRIIVCSFCNFIVHSSLMEMEPVIVELPPNIWNLQKAHLRMY